MNFIGFIEGNDITQGKASIIMQMVTGNVALKSAEGIVTMTSQLIKQSVKNILTKRRDFLYGLLSKRCTKRLILRHIMAPYGWD